jgi:exodeoxyribonuclease VII large subunit
VGEGICKMQKIYTVSEITKEIKTLLEENIPTIWVEGEVSNFTLHSSGHRYFSLKDENSQIRCVFWKWQAYSLSFEIEDGMKVIALGNITIYERNGQYQLNIIKIKPLGIGKLELEFQRLKEKLFKEGLFDESHKIPIPKFPQTIGVVTSPTGAAIRDIIEIIQRRAPDVKIILNPVKVQGPGAAEEIAQAIYDFNEYKKVDLLIVGRGGGSLEDLWAFNEEIVARAIYDSKIPVISAIGHEIDFTIADFVADLRVPTPSAAAELAVRDRAEICRELNTLINRLITLQSSSIDHLKQRVESAIKSYGFKKRPMDLVGQLTQRTDELTRNLFKEIKNCFEFRKKSLSLFMGKLNALSPLAVFKRGFSLTRKLPELLIIKDAGILKIDDRVEVKFLKGRIESKVEKVDKE